MTVKKFYGWKLLVVFWIIVFINLAFPLYGASVLNSVMMNDLHLDRKMLGFLFSLFSLMSGLPGPLVAVCVERFGIRITLILGSLFVAAGSFLMATAVNTGMHAAIAFGVLIGAGVSMGGVISTQAGLTKWFIRRRALVLSILSASTGVGGFVAAPQPPGPGPGGRGHRGQQPRCRGHRRHDPGPAQDPDPPRLPGALLAR